MSSIRVYPAGNHSERDHPPIDPDETPARTLGSHVHMQELISRALWYDIRSTLVRDPKSSPPPVNSVHEDDEQIARL